MITALFYRFLPIKGRVILPEASSYNLALLVVFTISCQHTYMKLSETHLLASPELEMPFEMKNGKVHGSLLIQLELGCTAIFSRYNEAGQPRSVIEIAPSQYHDDGYNTFIVRHQGLHGLPPLAPGLRLPVSHNLHQRNIRLAEHFANGHTNRIFLGPSLHGETLYGPNREVERNDSLYGVMRPYRLTPDTAPYLQVVMPKRPYGNMGIIAVDIIAPTVQPQ